MGTFQDHLSISQNELTHQATSEFWREHGRTVEAMRQIELQNHYDQYPDPRGLFSKQCPHCRGKLIRWASGKGGYGCYYIIYDCASLCGYKYAYRHHTWNCCCGGEP